MEIRFAPVADCNLGDPSASVQAVSNVEGDYRVVARLGIPAGVYCVFAWAAGSDSVSTGQVRFTSDRNRSEPVQELDLDVYLK